METLNGNVTSIKVLKMSERPLVYFKLDGKSCLIAKHSLSFIADVENDMKIAVAGYYNRRKQFVVTKYAVIGKTKIMIDIENIYNLN